MATLQTVPFQRYLRTTEAARLLGLSGSTLEKHRGKGTGPRYCKLGGRVVYRPKSLLKWAARGFRTSTLEKVKDPIETTISKKKKKKHRKGKKG